jgi:hypothetical protein
MGEGTTGMMMQGEGDLKRCVCIPDGPSSSFQLHSAALTTRARSPNELRETPLGQLNVAALPTPSEKGVGAPRCPASVRTAPVETVMARIKWLP